MIIVPKHFWRLLRFTEAYSKSCNTSKTKHFAKIISIHPSYSLRFYKQLDRFHGTCFTAFTEAAIRGFYSKLCSSNFAKFRGKFTWAEVSFKKIAGTQTRTFIKKRGSSTVLFLWVLLNFYEHPFAKYPPPTASEFHGYISQNWHGIS